ncbi:winged helix-turn-helix domain-containing protein [Streptomyces sp. NPDC051940]|uniref:ArsR/SmtB family transcription factor n=1 Tax=Streptomyces sp. NPDC051940 TaxID=3155675 RepID=UPI003432226F
MGVLRLHFTAADLGRAKVAARPDPLWELVLSANLLGNRDGRAVFDTWRADARTRLRTLPTKHRHLIRLLAPPFSDFPDLLTPPAGQQGFEEGLDAVLSTPRQRITRELAALGTLPAWTTPLLRGESGAVRALGHALRGYFGQVLEPYWPRIAAQVEADQARRARAFVAGGVDGVLNSFRPLLRWQYPVLEAPYPHTRDIHLDGRGLLLIPSVVCWRTPVTWIDPELPPVLVYPVERTAQWWSRLPPPNVRDTLTPLIGGTRSAILRAAAEGGSCGELARRAAHSPTITSYHLKVLRDAGLVTSLRDGPYVVYAATPLGHDLLLENQRGGGANAPAGG